MESAFPTPAPPRIDGEPDQWEPGWGRLRPRPGVAAPRAIDRRGGPAPVPHLLSIRPPQAMAGTGLQQKQQQQ
ncbi:hypothetical protein chiPu_0022356, partial [Chiloscyllium punctatum]|nr:hypothetical protein [Chiloscyllium punctatum]